MTVAHRGPGRLALIVLAALLVTGACASPAPSAAPPTGTAPPGTQPASASAPPAGGFGPDVPLACISLERADCDVAASLAAAALLPGDGQVVYVQVGPFGCPGGDACPRTLAARPSGDVVIELRTGEPVAVHIEDAGGRALVTREPYFGISLEPSSGPAAPAGPVPFSLGDCGRGCGIDLDGSWWDPVGSVEGDHGDSINAADGTIAAIDRDHATFTSAGGFVVSLQRRVGPKYLPLCA
jgi:hypothetical protein